MTKQFRLWRRTAALLGATALVAGVVAIAPAASVAHGGATKCANKQIKIPQEGGPAIHIPVKAISTEGGVSCSSARAFCEVPARRPVAMSVRLQSGSSSSCRMEVTPSIPASTAGASRIPRPDNVRSTPD